MVDLTFDSTKMIQVLFIGDDGELLTSKAFISKIIRTKPYRENPEEGSESITNPGEITVTFKLSGRPADQSPDAPTDGGRRARH